MSVLAEYFAFECKKFDSKLAVFQLIRLWQDINTCASVFTTIPMIVRAQDDK
jgi:hypothetical protein